LKTVASILFAFLLLWHPSTAATSGNCGGDLALACARCCCCTTAPAESNSTNPLAPVPSRPAAPEQLTLLLPTITSSLLLEQSSQTSNPSQAELSNSAGALPLFQRDCALLL
jgi:hypothetical protein